MPYLVTTNKHSTSALHCVAGLFFGRDVNFGESVSVIVNHGTRISIYETRRRLDGDPQKSHDFTVVSDVPVNGTVRLMESLPIVDPSTGAVTRHILFILTEKQDYLLLAFERTGAGAGGPDEEGDDDNLRGGGKPIVVHCLFTGVIESLFFQGHINGEECSAATGNDFISRYPPGKPLTLFPVVCFSIFSGTLFIVDVAAAIGEGSQRPSSANWKSLFPPDFWSLVVAPRTGLATCNIRNVEESTFSSLSWGTLSPSATSNSQMTLYILYADRRSRSHVAEYSLDLVPPPVPAGRGDGPRGGAVSAPALALILSATVGHTSDSPKSTVIWRRVQTLQSDVEAEATLLHSVRSGVVVIGPQLITFIHSANVAKSNRRANVVTTTMPPGGTKVPAEPRCVTSIDGNSFLVALASGALVHVELKATLEEWEATLLPGVEEEIKEVTCTVRAATAAVPECMTYFSAGYCFVGSHFSNSVLVDLRSGESTTVIENIGPILEMVVVEDGPRMLVVASTGLNRNGALQLLRSAVSLVEDAAIPDMESVRRVDAAGPFVCLSLFGASRFLRSSCGSASTGPMVLEELCQTEFDESAETLCFGLLCPTTRDYIQVTHDKVLVVRDGPGPSLRKWESLARIQDAFAFPSGCCVCAGSNVHVFAAGEQSHRYELVPTVTLRCANEVACAVLTSNGELFVGEWSSNAIKYKPSIAAIGSSATASAEVDTVLATFDGVPRSLQVTTLSGGTARYLFASFPDGTVSYGKIIEAVPGLSSLTVNLQTIKLSSQPVGLTLVEAPDGTAAVLCTGDVPSVMYESHGRIQVTGVALRDIESYATLRNESGVRSICFSRTDATIRIGRVGSAQRISKTTLEVKQTVSKITYLSPWRCFAAALRMRDRDDIFLYSLVALEGGSKAAATPPPAPLPLMEAERCVFIECLAMGGPAASLSEVAPIRTRAEWSNNAADVSSHFQCVLIGTSFVFPEESTARSSRLVWATVEAREGLGPALAPLGEKDIVGALSSCCMVPNCPGRVAVGINGSIHLFRWNALERDLVAEANVVVGSLLTQVVPVFPKDCNKTGILVAGDCRYSVVAVRVNVVDSAIEVMCRDLALRPVMNLVVADNSTGEPVAVTERPTLQGREIVFSDEHLNIFSVSQSMTLKSQDADRAAAAARSRRRSGGGDDDDDEASAPPDSSPDDEQAEATYVPGKSFDTSAQIHMGDRINCLRVGTFAALPNLWSSLVPGGPKGQQLVFGTCHGALGSIIALDGLVFTFLTLLEHSIRELVAPLGGLSTSAFREVLARGKQKRKVALGSVSAAAQFDARGFCDGDVIESFLELPPRYQEKVTSILNEKFAVKVAQGGDGFPQIERHKKSITERLLADGSVLEDAEEPLAPPTEQQLEDAVELIVQRGLPPYPFTAAALSHLVSDLSRAH